MTFVPFHRANQVADDFLLLLSQLNIHPVNQGRIEGEFLSVTELLDIWKKGVAPPASAENILRTAAGVHDFAAKVVGAQHLSGFASFRDHLALIAAGTLQTTLSQMDAGSPIDDAARKLPELYIACLAIHCGTNITLDHPSQAKGDNPDVMLDYRGQRWAIAIKTTSSTQGQTLYENIKKASQQIEASPADAGLILLNVKNSIDHVALWKKRFTSLSEAQGALKEEMTALCDAADLNRPSSEWDEVFKGKARSPILLMAQTVVQLPTPASNVTPTPLKMMLASPFGRKADQDAWELASCLTHWMQVIV